MNAIQDIVYTPEQTKAPARSNILVQLLRFVLVGGLNTAIDLLVLNSLLRLFPTHDSLLLVIYNSCAYATGALNSFCLNRYWTFERGQQTSWREILRFSIVTVSGIACNNTIIWLVSSLFHPLIVNALIWANVSKVLAIIGTVLISFLGMRLWVFMRPGQATKTITMRRIRIWPMY